MRVLISLLCYFMLSSVAGASNETWMPTGFLTSPPPGWIDFCKAYSGECTRPTRDVAVITLTPDVLAQMQKVNHAVNAAIVPMNDLDHWGVPEQWNFGEDGYGDCEDYALIKRRNLTLLNYPESALLITVVIDGAGEGHAVLTVVTDRGDLVLDNQRDEILPWYRTGYQFVKRQSPLDPNVWLKAGEASIAGLFDR